VGLQWRRQDFEPALGACMFIKSGRNHINFYTIIN